MLPSETTPQVPTTRFINVYDLMDRMRLSRASIYSLVRRGLLPAPIKLGHASRWIEEDVEKALTALRGGFEHVITTRPVTRRPHQSNTNAAKS